MLEMTLATDFVPGVNLKGKVSGATWLYLLPQVDLERIVCLGYPLRSTLEVLASFGRELILIVRHGQETAVQTDASAFDNVEIVPFSNQNALPLEDGCADLIFLTDQNIARPFYDKNQQHAELLRLLAPDGLIYYEGRASFLSRVNMREPAGNVNVTGSESRFWLTPLSGEMQTAVPYDDSQTVAYFLKAKLYSPMFDLPSHLSKRAKRFSSKRSGAAGAEQRSVKKNRQGTRNKQARLKQSLRGAGARVFDAVGRIERLVDNKRPLRRYGVIYGSTDGLSDTSPPRYLRHTAEDCGKSIDGYRWGLSARGQYSSRKMLFYLFDPVQKTGRTQPNIIVKMVRDPGFSYRLENEARSLQHLEAAGILDPEILPRVIFAGRHAGLAIVGESVIEGVPFRQKSLASADCPYGLAALNWFVELGAATADVHSAAPLEIAQALTDLLERFVAIYRPTTEQQDLLEQQIAKIGRIEAAVPLVFQHGDPGPWNMLVTPQGRVAILDWEAAETHGMPAWDLFYFMRSFSLDAARQSGISNRLQGFKQQFLDDTPLSRLFVETIRRYCQAINLDTTLIEPLFYTCWMHRALKESMRLEPAKLDQGHFANLIWWCREHSDAPTLQQLFSMPAEVAARGELVRNV